MHEIKNHPTMIQVLQESYGGIMYNVANRSKYDATELLQLWEGLPADERESADGIITGAINFLKD